MQKAYLIPDIDKLVQKQLKELGLKPCLKLRSFKEKRKRFYTTPCKTKKGIFLFKMLISKRKEDGLSLQREIAITRFLSELSPKAKLNVLLFHCGETKRFPCWYLRRYLTGPIIGRHFKIYQAGFQKGIQTKIVSHLLTFQALSSQAKNLPLTILSKKTLFEDYLKQTGFFEKKLKKEMAFEKIYNFLRAQKRYFKQNVFALSHGDFTLANFFVNKNKLYLTDWEHVHIDNFAADISRLWIQAYRYSKWRRKLILEFLKKLPESKKEIFKELFRTMAMFEAIKEFFCDSLKTPKETSLKKAVRKTVEAAFQGFNNLMSL